MRSRRTKKLIQTGTRARGAEVAARTCIALLAALLFLGGCFSLPITSDATKRSPDAAPELPESYETEVRGLNRTLIQAAFNGKTEQVHMVFAAEDSESLKDEYINASLLLASVRGNTDTLLILLDHGADANSITVRGGTALMWAAGSTQNTAATVRMLLQAGAEVNSRAENGSTALMDAAARGNTDIIDLLIAAGAKVDAKTDQGVTALMIAAAEGHVDCVSGLLRHGADLDAVDNYEQTALRKAVKAKQQDVIDLLIREGANR